MASVASCPIQTTSTVEIAGYRQLLIALTKSPVILVKVSNSLHTHFSYCSNNLADINTEQNFLTARGMTTAFTYIRGL